MPKHSPPSKHKSQQPKPPPRCKAILICERTLIEAGSGSVSLIAIFDRFELSHFPSASRAFEMYLVLVDGIGSYDLVVEIEDLPDGSILGYLPTMEIEWPQRLTRMTMIIPVTPVLFDRAGEYDIVVLADGQEIERLKFSAINSGGRRDAEDEQD